MRVFEPWHLIVLLLVIAILFGSKRLPDAARGLGRSMRIFKAEVKEMREEDGRKSTTAQPSSGPETPQPIEGRIIESDGGRGGAPSEQRRDV